MQSRVMSFGYKHGLPLDVDVVLDCRFLPNPHWVDELRPLTGLDDAVERYVLDQPAAQEFLDHLDGRLALLLPAYVAEGKSYLPLALGCTGGPPPAPPPPQATPLPRPPPRLEPPQLPPA